MPENKAMRKRQLMAMTLRMILPCKQPQHIPIHITHMSQNAPNEARHYNAGAE